MRSNAPESPRPDPGTRHKQLAITFGLYAIGVLACAIALLVLARLQGAAFAASQAAIPAIFFVAAVFFGALAMEQLQEWRKRR